MSGAAGHHWEGLLTGALSFLVFNSRIALILNQALILQLSTLWYKFVVLFCYLFILWDALRPKHSWLKYTFPLVLCMIIPCYNIHVAIIYWQSQGRNISFLEPVNTGKWCQAGQR